MERNQVTPKSFIFREIICSLLLGGIPCILMLQDSGVVGLVIFLKSMVPPNVLSYYLCFLVLSHFIFWFLNCYFYSPINSISQLKTRLHQISDQIGFSLIGVYRVIAGALLIAPPSMVIVEPTFNNFIFLGACYFLSISSIAISCYLSYWQSKTVTGI
ncbi:hypothetical protein [Pseudoalteromonas denitrificans]|uniref:Uncharacterized protein n=1 Tax=Pseudoalteromonas denitrificans DSM 6059 TaxID=1123010 RepID=A0A1I1EUD5_9GAMM|nr:hypothetical protein [Pseudoalteromonas denitrificans]SFB90246.1 hypothetical protein SAMN02745724_00429 [Pseudoalteromonas denitrificans DSM 6059]